MLAVTTYLPKGKKSMAESPTTAPSRTQPAHEVRLGAIKAVIWKNDTDSGVRYNVTFQRLYRDGEDWKSTDSFGRDDLLVLGKVADLAHTWIMSPEPVEGRNAEHQKQSASSSDLTDKSMPRRSGQAKRGV